MRALADPSAASEALSSSPIDQLAAMFKVSRASLEEPKPADPSAAGGVKDPGLRDKSKAAEKKQRATKGKLGTNGPAKKTGSRRKFAQRKPSAESQKCSPPTRAIRSDRRSNRSAASRMHSADSIVTFRGAWWRSWDVASRQRLGQRWRRSRHSVRRRQYGHRRWCWCGAEDMAKALAVLVEKERLQARAMAQVAVK